VNGGITAVSRDTFVNARPVSRNIVTGQERELASAPITRNLAVQPARASYVGAGRTAASRPPAAVFSRTVVAKRTPPPQPARFQDRASGQPGVQPQGRQPIEGFGRPNQPGAPSDRPSGYRPPAQQNGQGANVLARNQDSNPGARAGFAERQPANPSVRQAPPARQATPAEQQNDVDKQKGWQQQHAQAHPAGRKDDKKK
jgi:hypothetical protein